MLSRELRDSSSRAVKKILNFPAKKLRKIWALKVRMRQFFSLNLLENSVEMSRIFPPKLAPKIRMRQFCFPNILHSMYFCIIIIITKQVNKL